MVRFAPSPTGDMDIGSLQVAIINYLVAQQRSDQFLVRIEDIDTQQNIEGKDTEIMMVLEKFALNHSSVFHQTEHLNLYQTLALRLLKEERAFVCKCGDVATDQPYSGHCENLTQEDYTQLKESGESFVIRIKKPKEAISYHDTVQGEITREADEIDSFVIVKADGKPTYDFASACDDMLSNIDLLIRSESYLTTTPKQIHIKNLLGYESTTQYAHLPTLMSGEGESYSVKWLFEQGFIPNAILNYLILLANPNAPQEIFTLPEAIEWFNLDLISKTAQTFELDKLRQINREHLKMMENRELSTLFGFADPEIGKLAKVYLSESSTIGELEQKIRPIFQPKDFSSELGEEMKQVADIIFNAPMFETFDAFKDDILIKSQLSEENLMASLRQLLTNAGSGPELSEIYPHIKSYILEVAS